jgi:hypothetical protein
LPAGVGKAPARRKRRAALPTRRRPAQNRIAHGYFRALGECSPERSVVEITVDRTGDGFGASGADAVDACPGGFCRNAVPDFVQHDRDDDQRIIERLTLRPSPHAAACRRRLGTNERSLSREAKISAARGIFQRDHDGAVGRRAFVQFHTRAPTAGGCALA